MGTQPVEDSFYYITMCVYTHTDPATCANWLSTVYECRDQAWINSNQAWFNDCRSQSGNLSDWSYSMNSTPYATQELCLEEGVADPALCGGAQPGELIVGKYYLSYYCLWYENDPPSCVGDPSECYYDEPGNGTIVVGGQIIDGDRQLLYWSDCFTNSWSAIKYYYVAGPYDSESELCVANPNCEPCFTG